MPYDANGKWIEEDTSVATRVAGLVQKDSPIMQQARAGAARSANRRGLLNSSIAVGAGEDAAIKSALPIASQDAQQASQRNIAESGQRNQREMQTVDNMAQDTRLGRTIASQEGQQRTDIDARFGLARLDNDAQATRLATSTASQERMNAADIAGQRERLATTIGGQERLQAAEAAAAKERQGIQLTSEETRQAAELKSAMDRLNVQTGSQERIATA